MRYILDSNVFIQAKNRYYSFDLCPGFWNWLETFSESNSVLSVEAVREELINGNDELAEWIKGFDKKHFLYPIQEIQTEFRTVTKYVNENYNKQAYINQFLCNADPWLIASAIHHDLTIVTEEQLVDSNAKRIKIPNICRYFNISYINTFELLAKEKVSFILH